MRKIKEQHTALFFGKPLALGGTVLQVGDHAPEFTVINSKFEPTCLADVNDKPLLLSSVVSIHTPICDIQARRFDEEAQQLTDCNIVVISADLPFSQDAFSKEANIPHIRLLSDYKDHLFANAYGVFIEELHLLSRSIFIIDRDGIIQYVEYVAEISDHPDYDSALQVLKSI